MADAGVTTPFLTPSALLDDVVGNRGGSTVRQPVGSLAAQLAASGAVADRIDEVEGLFTTNSRVAATWTDLLAASGDQDGQGGEVLDADAGTHLQATATGYDGASVANGGRYAWNASWSRWVRIGSSGLAGKASVADMVAVQALTQLEYISTTTGPIIRDLTGRLSATKPCLYIPRVYRFQRNGVVYSGVCTNSDSTEYPGHCRITISNAYYSVVYLNTSTQTFVVVTSAAGIPDLNITGRANTVLVYAGYGANYSAKMKVIDADERFDLQFDFGLPLIVEEEIPTVAEPSPATFLLIPPFTERAPWRENTLTARAPADGFYWRQDVATSPTVPRRHFFDKAAALRGETFLSSVDGPVAGSGEGILSHTFARSMGRIVTSNHQLAGAVNGGAGENQCRFSRAMDDITYQEGMIGTGGIPTAVDIADAYLADRGFTRGLQLGGGNGPFAGIDMPDTGASSLAFGRIYVKTLSAGNFGRVRMIFWRNGLAVDSEDLEKEESISDTIAIFSGSKRVVESFDKVTIGVQPNPTAATWIITGLQFSSGSGYFSWVLRADLPTQDGPNGRLTELESAMEQVTERAVIDDVSAAFEAAYPAHMWLASGRPAVIYPASIVSERTEGTAFEATFYSVGAPAGGYAPYVATGRGAIPLDPDRCGATGAISFRRHAADAADIHLRSIRNLTIHVAPASQTAACNIMVEGDSLSYQEAATRLKRKLLTMGVTATMIGTLVDVSGTPVEGHTGRTFGDFSGEERVSGGRMDPLAPGGEVAYLALGEGGKRVINPMLKEADAGDLADRTDFVFDGYIYDKRFYLDRFGFSDPDFVVINLGTNDISYALAANPTDPSAALGIMERAFAAMLAQNRTALPDAHIAFCANPMPRTNGIDARWALASWPILVKRQMQLVEAARATDSKVWFLPLHAHGSNDVGYSLATGSTDAATGLKTANISDVTHYQSPVTEQVTEVVAAWVASLLDEA